MIHRSLPSLAHPLILRPARGAKNHKTICIPPFPAINLNWEGFTFPHLHWAVINTTNSDRREAFIQLAKLHEGGHLDLSFAPFSQYVRQRFIDLYLEVVTTGEKKEVIDIPVNANESGNDLQAKLKEVDICMRASMCIEEVYAIRSSIIEAQNAHIIEPHDAQAIITNYKKEYGKCIRGFAWIYDVFDFVAGNIGERAAAGLVHSVLGTFNPYTAFSDIVCKMCADGFIWTLPKRLTRYLNNASVLEAYNYFNSCIKDMDPEDSKYENIKLLNYVVEAEQLGRNCLATKGIKDGLLELMFGVAPPSFLVSECYFENGSFKLELPRIVDGPHFAIFIEAILEQLVTGIGLVCPFWRWYHSKCCGGSNRSVLENVWGCTAQNSFKCSLWKRPTCLDL